MASMSGAPVAMDGYDLKADQSERSATAEALEEANIRKWLASLFVQTVKTGERFLEDGLVATAAAMFANATLLTNRTESFPAAVERVYPRYFYRLYERRMFAMGYDHLFAKTTNNGRPLGRGSPATVPLRLMSDDDINDENDLHATGTLSSESKQRIT